ncbi:MAG: FecR domain-containing protein [Prevotellaceae bacterium]|jgi:ferric-dicitrate binding protein FerR (iron transport regulator)|nr:FecR domain-containing protein [Prevotellaceae bacterium]
MEIGQEEEQEKLIWENIDLLFEKLEQGEATEEDIEKINIISTIIYGATAKNRKRKLSRSNLTGLLLKDLTFFRRESGLEAVAFPQQERYSRLRLIKYAGMGIAASILLAVGFFSFLMTHPMQTEITAKNNDIHCLQDTMIRLPDGTDIRLAAGSRLAIAEDYGKRERRVTLTGEAFFEVAKDAKRSFIVQTANMNAVVHGTSFNMVAYEGMASGVLAVRTGCVELTDKQRSFGKLLSGDRASYNYEMKKVSFSKVEPENVGAWKDGLFILENVSVDELIVRIRFRYGYELIIKEGSIPNDASINYSSYSESGIQSVIQSICEVYDTKSEADGSRITIYR